MSANTGPAASMVNAIVIIAVPAASVASMVTGMSGSRSMTCESPIGGSSNTRPMFALWISMPKPVATNSPLGWTSSVSCGAVPVSDVAAQVPRYREARVPLVVLAGRDDRVTPAAYHAEPMPALWGGPCELRVLPNAGHMLLRSHPEEVVAAVERAETLAAR